MKIPEYIPEPINTMMQGFSDEQNTSMIEGFEKTGQMEKWRIQHEIQKGVDEGRWTYEDIYNELQKVAAKDKE